MSGGFAAETLAGAEDLARIEPEWWALWRRCSAATPFQSPAWLIPWWRRFQPGELATVAVRRDGVLVGLAPFYCEDGALGRRLLPVGISLSDYLDVLLDPDCAAAAAAALAGGMVRGKPAWDSWELEELAPGAAALGLPLPPACTEVAAGQSACPVLDMPEGAHVADLLAPSKRRKLAMARNRASRRGEVIIAEAEPDASDAALEVLFRLHRARWAARGEEGLIDARVECFQRDAAPGLAAAGLVRLYTLSLAGEPAAAYYGFAHGGRAYAYLTGFDPAFAFESPSVILLAHAIERAATEGVREFHFLRGREPYKYEWGAVDRWNRRRSFRRVTADALA